MILKKYMLCNGEDMLKGRISKIVSGYLCYGAEFFEWDYAYEKDRLYKNEMLDLFQNGKYDEIGEKLAKWIKISGEEKKQIVKTLQSQRGGKKRNFEVDYKQLKDMFERKKPDDFSLGRWLMLKTYANIYGWYTFGLLCRDKAKKRVYDHPKKLNYWRLRLLACIEDGKDEEAKKCFALISSRPWLRRDKATWQMVEQYYRISVGDNQSLVCETEKLETKKKKYYEYINEHDIWIIGPTSEKINEQHIVKEGVAVIRFNYQGETWAKEANINSHTDISYYRRTGVEKYLNENVDESEYINTEYILLLSDSKKAIGGALADKTIEYEPTNRRITFEGAHNFLPTVIMDVCKYGKRGIKVTGTNLFLGEWYADNYDRVSDYGTIRRLTILCTPTANFSTLKLFYKWGVIEPVGELRRVLDMELKDYVEAMEQKYTLSVMQ